MLVGLCIDILEKKVASIFADAYCSTLLEKYTEADKAFRLLQARMFSDHFHEGMSKMIFGFENMFMLLLYLLIVIVIVLLFDINLPEL